MSNFCSLKVLDFFRPLFEKANIDYALMRRILEVKLLMDGRRVPTVFNDSNMKLKGNKFFYSLGLYAFFSLLLLFFLVGDELMLQMSIVFGMSMFILMSALIADFSSVLLDVRDKTIIGTKPVNERTLGVAKLIHVMIYMTLLTGAFTIIPVVFMFFSQGFLFTLIFIVLMVLFVLFSVAITSLVYIFVLRIFDGDQLKNMINYIQILLSIGIVVGYQVVINAFNIIDLELIYEFSWWHILIPPMWFGAPFELIIHGDTSIPILLLSSLAVFVPIFSIYLYYQLMPAFERNLEKLLDAHGLVKEKKHRIRSIWEKLICSKKERKYFRFAYQIMTQEREFKLKVYPTIGMGLVFPFIFIIINLRDMTLGEISGSSMYLYMYFVNIIIGVAVHMLQFSSQFKGAWIFRIVNMNQPNLIYSAAIKVFLVRLYLPVMLLVGLGYSLIFSPSVWIDVVVLFLGAVLQSIIAYFITIRREFPFSGPFESMKEGGYTAKSFVLIFLTIPFVIVHYVSGLIPYGKIGLTLTLIVVIFILWKLTFFAERKKHLSSSEVK